MQNVRTCVCSQGWLQSCGGGVCLLKGLVQCVRGPFRLLSSQTKLWWRGSLQQDMAAGGERAAAALQTYSPAGGGYLSHLVQSSGWLIPSTATTTTHGEKPYLTSSLHLHSCLSTHTGRATEDNLSWGVKEKSQNLQHLKVYTALPVLKLNITGWKSGHWSDKITANIAHNEQNCR